MGMSYFICYYCGISEKNERHPVNLKDHLIIFRLIHKIGIYSYRPDIKGEMGGKGGEVSKKNQNNFQKTQ